LIQGAPGRGVQLAAGAAVATGQWLLFLHADTVLAEGWADAVRTHVATSQAAAVFRFALDDDTGQSRRLEQIVSWRCRLLALPYGDQGLLVSRQLYNEAGGFKPIALMEDVDIIRRIGRARLVFLDADAITSAARYQREGYVRRMCRNMACLAMWFAGVSPDRIARFYK
jgi:glycosyltransferase involved in cell wall biosynthesis